MTIPLVLKVKELPASLANAATFRTKSFFSILQRGEKRSIDSGMVNNYIKEITQADFTAKDFRTRLVLYMPWKAFNLWMSL